MKIKLCQITLNAGRVNASLKFQNIKQSIGCWESNLWALPLNPNSFLDLGNLSLDLNKQNLAQALKVGPLKVLCGSNMIFLFWGAALLEIHTDQGPRLVAAAALAASITTSNSNTSFRLVLFIVCSGCNKKYSLQWYYSL